eukprot:SAG31_NODE_6676_length_1929_cov_2.510929_1_plen_89_part_10
MAAWLGPAIRLGPTERIIAVDAAALEPIAGLGDSVLDLGLAARAADDCAAAINRLGLRGSRRRHSGRGGLDDGAVRMGDLGCAGVHVRM